MAPKSSSTSKATSSPSPKATTPAASKPPSPAPASGTSTPVQTQKQTTDILANASEAEYKQALSASDTEEKTNLEKGISFSHAL